MVYDGQYGNRIFLVSGIDEAYIRSLSTDKAFHPTTLFVPNLNITQSSQPPSKLLRSLPFSESASTSASQQFSFLDSILRMHEKSVTLSGELLLFAMTGRSPISVYGIRDEKELTAAEEDARTILKRGKVMFVEIIYKEERRLEIRKTKTLEKCPRTPSWLAGKVLTVIKSCLYDGGRMAIKTITECGSWKPYIVLDPHLMRIKVLSEMSSVGRIKDVRKGKIHVDLKFTSPKYGLLVTGVLTNAEFSPPTIEDLLGADWKSQSGEKAYHSGLLIMNAIYESYEFIDMMESLSTTLFTGVPRMTTCFMFLKMGATRIFERSADELRKNVDDYQTASRTLSNFCRQKRIVHAEVEWKSGNPEHNFNHGAQFLARAIQHYSEFRKNLLQLEPVVEEIFLFHGNFHKWFEFPQVISGFPEVEERHRYEITIGSDFGYDIHRRADPEAYMSHYMQKVLHCDWMAFKKKSTRWKTYQSNTEKLLKLLNEILDPILEAVEGALNKHTTSRLVGEQIRVKVLEIIRLRLTDMPSRNGNYSLISSEILELVKKCKGQLANEKECDFQLRALMHILMIAKYANTILPSLLQPIDPSAESSILSSASAVVFKKIEPKEFDRLLRLYNAVGLHPGE